MGKKKEKKVSDCKRPNCGGCSCHVVPPCGHCESHLAEDNCPDCYCPWESHEDDTAGCTTGDAGGGNCGCKRRKGDDLPFEKAPKELKDEFLELVGKEFKQSGHDVLRQELEASVRKQNPDLPDDPADEDSEDELQKTADEIMERVKVGEDIPYHLLYWLHSKRMFEILRDFGYRNDVNNLRLSLREGWKIAEETRSGEVATKIIYCPICEDAHSPWCLKHCCGENKSPCTCSEEPPDEL